MQNFQEKPKAGLIFLLCTNRNMPPFIYYTQQPRRPAELFLELFLELFTPVQPSWKGLTKSLHTYFKTVCITCFYESLPAYKFNKGTHFSYIHRLLLAYEVFAYVGAERHTCIQTYKHTFQKTIMWACVWFKNLK